MSKANVSINNDYEGLFYVDYENFSSEYEIEYSQELFADDFMEKFQSFSECDEWISRNERAILENQLFYVVVEDNEWSVAYKLIQKDNYYYNSIEGLQAKHYQSYLEGIKKALFNQFETIGIYAGAWTSGVIHREKQAV